MKKLIKYLILIILALIPFVFLEWGFRYGHELSLQCPSSIQGERLGHLNDSFVPHKNPGLEFNLCRNLDSYLLGESIKSNSEGYRGREWSVFNPDNLRIVGVGDSVMMGWGVGDGEDFFTLASEGVAEKYEKNTDIYNLSMAGHDADHHYHTFYEYVVGLKPDIVVLSYVGNDWEVEGPRDRSEQFSSPSYLLNYIVLKTLQWSGRIAEDERIVWAPHSWPEVLPKDLVEAYNEIAKLADIHDIPIILVMDSRYESPMARHSAVVDLAEHLDFTVLNLFEMWRDIDYISPHQAVEMEDIHNRRYLIPGDNHPNRNWHNDVSEHLQEIMIEELF